MLRYLVALLFPRRTIHAQYIRGPRGGCYTTVTRSGSKRYVDRSLCESGESTKPEKQSSRSSEQRAENAACTSGGPRAGCYYITTSGSKRYVETFDVPAVTAVTDSFVTWFDC